MRLAALTLLLVTPAFAAPYMTAEEFDAMTRGKTFYYAEDGQDYGAEDYLDNRRVRWSFLDGRCKDGHWYPQDDMICFVYEEEDGLQSEPQCWSFTNTPSGLVAQFRNLPGGSLLYQTRESDEPMLCMGPDVGA